MVNLPGAVISLPRTAVTPAEIPAATFPLGKGKGIQFCLKITLRLFTFITDNMFLCYIVFMLHSLAILVFNTNI